MNWKKIAIGSMIGWGLTIVGGVVYILNDDVSAKPVAEAPVTDAAATKATTYAGKALDEIAADLKRDDAIRLGVCRFLIEQSPFPNEAVAARETLKVLLTDPLPEVRRAGVVVWAKFRPFTKADYELLAGLLSDADDETVRRAAAVLSVDLEAAASALAPAFAEVGSRRRLGAVMTAARHQGPGFAAVWSQVAAALDDPLPQTQAIALRALAEPIRYGTANQPGVVPTDRAVLTILPTILGLRQSPNASVRQAATFATERLRPVIIPLLIHDLNADDPMIRTAAVEMLKRYGKEGYGQVLDALMSEFPSVYDGALLVLSAGGAEAVPVLQRGLKDANPQVRRGSATALGRLGIAAQPALADLIGLLRETDRGVRETAATTLIELGPTSGSALRRALLDPEAAIRAEAAICLARMGAEGRAALRELQDAAGQDADPLVRRAAADAVQKLNTP